MDQSFVAESTMQRQRLRALVSRLTDDELALPLADGWTVAAALAHLAFWDQRGLVLLRRWAHSGVGSSPIDVDATNDTILPLCLALVPRVAANLALQTAETIDRTLAQSSPQFIADIHNLGKFRLNRGLHRCEHLDEIEAALRLVVR